METNLPLAYLVVTLATNWVVVPREFKHSQGTNYLLYRQVVSTNTLAYEVRLCTNRVDVSHHDSGTNGPTEYRVAPATPERL